MHNEKANAEAAGHAALASNRSMEEKADAHGQYFVQCISPAGSVRWEDTADNVVTTVGKNAALDAFLAGSTYTAACYIGLINVNANLAAAGDTMASHAAWLEVGTTNDPHYTAPRKTPSWSAAAAGAKATSVAASFAITSSGTVGGCFLVFGTGAVSTIDNTSGVLYSAGAFTNGSKPVSNGDTLNVTYTGSL